MITVAIPTRNRSMVLPQAIKSLLEQDYPIERYEIIVVDDGSQDDTPQVVERLMEEMVGQRLRYIALAPGGLNAARNAAIRIARGDPICFVDDDVDVPRGWLSAIAAGVARHPEGGCFGGPIRIRLEGKAPRICEKESFGTRLDLGTTERPVETVWGANLAITREGLKLAGPFDETIQIYGDEEEWQLRLRSRGGSVIYLPEAWLWHRRTPKDLRPGYLLKAAFRRGRLELTAYRRMQRHVSPAQQLVLIPRYLAHSVRRGCFGGLILASTSLGRLWGLLIESSKRVLGGTDPM